MTTTDLSRRLTCHLNNGAPKTHMRDVHDQILSREDLVQNTVILKHCSDKQRWQIYETLYIYQIKPTINQQITGSYKSISIQRSTQYDTKYRPQSTRTRAAPTDTA